MLFASLGLLLVVLVGLAVWLLVLRKPSGPMIAEYATRPAAVRSSGDPAASTVIGQVQRGDAETGAWGLGPDGKTRWLKIRWGAGAGYLSALDLSDRPRPALASAEAGAKAVLAAGVVYPEPDAATTVIDAVSPGAVLITNGITADGWTEVASRSGAIGYVKADVFQAPAPPVAEQTPPPAAAAADAAATPATAPTGGTFTYACAYAPEQGVNAPAVLPGMSFTVDEDRACVNNRSAYRRDAQGGLSRVMLVDAERRASLLYFTPDRRTFSRQDVMLSPDAYGRVRQMGQVLLHVTCPVPGDAAGAARVADALASATPDLDPQNLPPGSGWRRMSWRCAPVQ